MEPEPHDLCTRCHRPSSFHPFEDCSEAVRLVARRPRLSPASTLLQLVALSAIAGSRMGGPVRPDFGPYMEVDSFRRAPEPERPPKVPRTKMRTAEENERRKKRKAQRHSRKGRK